LIFGVQGLLTLILGESEGLDEMSMMPSKNYTISFIIHRPKPDDDATASRNAAVAELQPNIQE